MKKQPIEAAQNYIENHHADCEAALLCGSTAGHNWTTASDLDIVIFDSSVSKSYRQSFIYEEWDVEIFVHNFESYKEICDMDIQNAKPSMLRMILNGRVIKYHPKLDEIKSELNQLWNKGPAPWNEKTIEMNQYFISDLLNDLMSSVEHEEQLFIFNELIDKLIEFELRTNQRWSGSSKWKLRELKEYDSRLADEILHSMTDFYKKRDTKLIETIVLRVLEPYGGYYFSGFRID